MKKETMVLSVLTLSAFVLSGCLVTTKTYKLTKDRVDQDLAAGNRGYLKGQPPAEEESKARKTTRETQVIEMEFGRQKPERPAPAAAVSYPVPREERVDSYLQEEVEEEIPSAVSFREYKVQKNDTLQKISMKFYGTTRKWKKIYEANSSVLKGPNKIYPGQTINIPEEGIQLMETEENLK